MEDTNVERMRQLEKEWQATEAVLDALMQLNNTSGTEQLKNALKQWYEIVRPSTEVS